MTSKRYCKKCKKETLHITRKLSGVVEKPFIGVVSLGIVPLIEALDRYNNRWFGSETRCDVCDTLKEEN